MRACVALLAFGAGKLLLDGLGDFGWFRFGLFALIAAVAVKMYIDGRKQEREARSERFVQAARAVERDAAMPAGMRD